MKTTNTDPKKISIAVLFGGISDEHAVSCVSAGNIIDHLDPEKYEVIPIGITKNGKWVRVPNNELVLDFSDLNKCSVNPNNSRINICHRERWSDGIQEIPVDVVFPMIHGPFGEDGTIQGMLEILGIPYVGSGVLASAVCMDKSFTKKILQISELPVVDGGVVYKTNPQDAIDLYKTLGPNVYIKPARGGSSYGVYKISSLDDLEKYLPEAFKYDKKILMEKEIKGREIEIGILEYSDGRVEASCSSEIVVSGQMYDFETKYLNLNQVKIQLPADINENTYEKMIKMAKTAFNALGCNSMARVDFFYVDNELYINEVNTIPGFTPSSQYPRMWQYSGIPYKDLLEILIDSAIDKNISRIV